MPHGIKRWIRALLLGSALCVLGVIMMSPDSVIKCYLRWIHHLDLAYLDFQLQPGSVLLKDSIWKKQGQTWLSCQEMVWQWDRWWAPWQGSLHVRGAQLVYDPTIVSKGRALTVPTCLQEFEGQVHLATPNPLPIHLQIQGSSRFVRVELDHPLQDCRPLIQRLIPSLDPWMGSLSEGSVQGFLTIQITEDQPLTCDANVEITNLEWSHDRYPIAIAGEGTVSLHIEDNERLLHAEWKGCVSGIEGKGYLRVDSDHVQGQWVGQGVGDTTWPAPFFGLTTQLEIAIDGTPHHVVCNARIEGAEYPTWEGGVEYLPYDHSWGRGWFHLPNLDMAHWVSPLLLGDFPLQFKGTTDLWAAFDDSQLLLWLSPHDWALHGEHFSLTFYDQENSWAYGAYTWEEGLLHGSMPVHRACYEQRNRGFKMDHLEGTLRTHGRRIFLDDVEVNWHSLPIYGNVVAEIQGSDRVDLSIQAGCKEGSLEDGMALLRHFVETPLTQFPWQGVFSISPGDFSFCFHLTPDETMTDGYVRGYTTFGADIPLGLHYNGSAFFYYESGALSLSYGELALGYHDAHFQGDELSLYLDEDGGILHLRDSDGGRLEAHYDAHEWVVLYDATHEIRCCNESGSWSTDVWRWGAWDGSIQCHQEMGRWQIPSFQLAHPEYGSVALALRSTREEIAADLSFQLPHIENLLLSHQPSWVGNCVGRAQGSWSAAHGIEGSICITESSYQLRNQPVKHLPPVTIRCSPMGWSLDGWEALGFLDLSRVKYFPATGALSIEGIDIHFSASQFSELMAIVQEQVLSDDHLGARVSFSIPVTGKVSLLWSGTSWQIQAEEILSSWKDTEYRSPWFTWTVGPKSIDCQGLFIEGTTSLLTSLHVERSHSSPGTLLIQEEGEDDGLLCTWHCHPQFGWVMDRLEGQLLGSVWHLRRHPTHDLQQWELSGHVTWYPQQWGPFLPHSWQNRMESCKPIGTYDWTGRIVVPAHHPDQARMIGSLVGTECACLGIQWASLTADCTATLEEIAIRNVHIQDWAGTAVCEEIVLSKADPWYLRIPHIELQDIRLAHVDSPWTRYQKGEKNLLRTLQLSSLLISNLSGSLRDWPSFAASGSCTFYTVPRRTLFSNLMLIPTEISARIGLDISNFIPARGTILFELDHGKVELVNLLDMYSEAKRSRFYLVDTESSYIDLTGQMHVAIRMKQYNLLMKWVDLFTLTLSGSLDAPRYTLTPALRTSDGEF